METGEKEGHLPLRGAGKRTGEGQGGRDGNCEDRGDNDGQREGRERGKGEGEQETDQGVDWAQPCTKGDSETPLGGPALHECRSMWQCSPPAEVPLPCCRPQYR